MRRLHFRARIDRKRANHRRHHEDPEEELAEHTAPSGALKILHFLETLLLWDALADFLYYLSPELFFGGKVLETTASGGAPTVQAVKLH